MGPDSKMSTVLAISCLLVPLPRTAPAARSASMVYDSLASRDSNPEALVFNARFHIPIFTTRPVYGTLASRDSNPEALVLMQDFIYRP